MCDKIDKQSHELFQDHKAFVQTRLHDYWHNMNII